jgi:ferredoxin-thioredoxin reductase catalytic chain
MNQDELKEKSEVYAKEQGYRLNPEKKITDNIIKGLLRNNERFGELYCPCRMVTEDKEKDKEIICPCIFHKEEIKSMGHCHCMLFVRG